jgi:hypothetical protein
MDFPLFVSSIIGKTTEKLHRESENLARGGLDDSLRWAEKNTLPWNAPAGNRRAIPKSANPDPLSA